MLFAYQVAGMQLTRIYLDEQEWQVFESLVDASAIDHICNEYMGNHNLMVKQKKLKKLWWMHLP